MASKRLNMKKVPFSNALNTLSYIPSVVQQSTYQAECTGLSSVLAQQMENNYHLFFLFEVLYLGELNDASHSQLKTCSLLNLTCCNLLITKFVSNE